MKILRHRRGSASTEFAVTLGVLASLTLGTIEVGLLMWVRGSLQSVAALVARCGAIGALGVGDCTTTEAAQSFAVTIAGTWVVPGVIATTDVTATPAAPTCKSATGKFYKVTITSDRLANGMLPVPMNQSVISVTACYPMA